MAVNTERFVVLPPFAGYTVKTHVLIRDRFSSSHRLAATQANHTSALNTMVKEAYQFPSSALAKFVNMQPEGGYTGCRDDLYVLATNIATGAVTISAADQPLTQSINTKTSMYELQVKSVYDASPLVSLAAVPVLGNVPGLGRPARLTLTTSRPIEHPGGLQSAPNSSNSQGTTVQLLPRMVLASSPSVPLPPSAITWRDPNIYQQIQAAG